MRKLLLGTISILIGVVLGLGLIEASVRFLKRDIAFQPDPELIRSLRPNVVRKIYGYETQENLNGLSNTIPPRPVFLGMDYTNNVGLRMRADVGPKADNERRILLMGDSYAEAEGVQDEQRFYSLVNDHLRDLPSGNSRWRILNAAIQNGTPSQYILQLRKYLDRFQPDIVLVSLAPNDVNDDYGFEQYHGYIFDKDVFPLAPKTPFRLWLLQKMWSLRYFEVVLNRVSPQWHTYFFPPASPEVFVPDWKSMLCSNDEKTRNLFKQKTGRYLTHLRQMTEEHNAKFGVFLIHYMWVFDNEPFYEPQYPGLKTEMEKWKCNDINANLYNNFIEGFLKQNHIEFSNSYYALKKSKESDPKCKLWYFYDYHFSPAGHQVVAQEMLTFLKSLIGVQSSD